MNYNTKQSIITCTPTLINRCADNKKKTIYPPTKSEISKSN